MAITLTLTVTDVPGRSIRLDWSPWASPMNFYYNQDGGGWIYWKTLVDGTGLITSTTDGPLAIGTTWGYFVNDGSDSSNDVYILFGASGTTYSDTITNTITATSAVTHTQTARDTITNTISPTSATTTVLNASDTITNTVTMTVNQASSQSVGANFSWYVSDDAGNVYTYSPAYKSDNGDIITASWRTKTIDFADLSYDWAGEWKTVYKARVIYVDTDASMPITFSWSIDGGTTWNGLTRTVGTGSGKTASKEFFFMETAQYFDFKVESGSASVGFQIIGLEIEAVLSGPHFE